jgi:transposase
MQFWHCKCVCSLSQKTFTERYRKWCKKNGYNFRESKAEDIYIESLGHFSVMPMNETTESLIKQAIIQTNAISETIAAVAHEMKRLAASLPEYPVVIGFRGVGELLASQLIAEIGNIYRYRQKSSIVRFAGLEPVENQSGKFVGTEKISKQGSPHLRKTLFQVMNCLIQHAPTADPIFQFLDRKRAEGKHYYSYMNAGAAKFLRVYYARVKNYLDNYYNEA